MSPVEGVVHRYPDRVLLKLVHVCPVYCRFCFRREMVGPRGRPTLSPRKLAAALDYVAGAPGIWEVILTGGDPLVLSPRRLRAVMARLARDRARQGRPHPYPCAGRRRPRSSTPALVAALRAAGQGKLCRAARQPSARAHAAARAACARIVDAGIPMLSQSVLLKGVNDDAAVLAELMRAFVACRIKPYYLHHGDLAPGTSHLRTTIEEGQALMRALRGRLSGIAQPAYVLDIPGGAGKVPIGPAYIAPGAGERGGRYEVADAGGRRHRYPPPADRPKEPD